MKTWQRRFLEVSLLLCMLFSIFMGYVLYLIAESIAFWNPELAHMQWFVYFLCCGAIACVLVGLAMGYILVLRSAKESIFTKRTVQYLQRMGHAFLGAVLCSLTIMFYSFTQVGTDLGMPGMPLYVMILVFFTAANVFYFISYLFREAVSIREENEGTV